MVLEERDEQRTGKPDDVQVVTLDALDNGRAAPEGPAGAAPPVTPERCCAAR